MPTEEDVNQLNMYNITNNEGNNNTLTDVDSNGVNKDQTIFVMISQEEKYENLDTSGLSIDILDVIDASSGTVITADKLSYTKNNINEIDQIEFNKWKEFFYVTKDGGKEFHHFPKFPESFRY